MSSTMRSDARTFFSTSSPATRRGNGSHGIAMSVVEFASRKGLCA